MRNPFKKTVKLSGRVIKAWEHNGWGNSVDWSSYENLRVVGWLSNTPEVNDEIQFKMLRAADKKEVVTRYIITDVDYCRDPQDMFFATVKPFAYLGEPITDKYIREFKNVS